MEGRTEDELLVEEEEEVDEEAIQTSLLQKLKPIEKTNNEKLRKVEEESRDKRKIEKRAKRKREEEDLYPFQKTDPCMNPVLKHAETKASRAWKKIKDNLQEDLKFMLQGRSLDDVVKSLPDSPKAEPGSIDESAEKLVAWFEKCVPEDAKALVKHMIPHDGRAVFLRDMLGPARWYWKMGLMETVMGTIYRFMNIDPSKLLEKQKSAEELKGIIVETLERLEALEGKTSTNNKKKFLFF